jgi:P2 family phage contractile tail tube protein
MGLPRTLQNLMLFNEGQSYVGEVKTVTLPTLTRKLEEYRGGGMFARSSSTWAWKRWR